MRIFFRTDSSAEIGSGHVMRCLTLAGELVNRGAKIVFICRAHPDGLSEWIRSEKKSPVIDLPLSPSFRFVRGSDDPPCANWLHEDWERDATLTYDAVMTRGGGDWLVTDHYALSARWEKRVKGCVKKTLVIDDLADRPHECEALLDQNYFQNPGPRYQGLVPETCVKLLGPRYALLRPEFAGVPGRPVRERVENVVVFFGAGDPAGLMPRTLRVLKPLAEEFGFTTHALAGALSPYRDQVEAVSREVPRCVFYRDFADLGGLLKMADLFVGAGGTVTWERAALGVPAVIVAAAANQNPFSEDLAKDGMQTYLGPAATLSDASLSLAIRRLLTDVGMRGRFAAATRALVDGSGARRVADVLLDALGGEGALHG